MKINNLEAMYKGWFVGDFIPSIYSTSDIEIAVKYYDCGDYEESHTHKIATELTVIIEGEAKMNDAIFRKGDIITLLPGDETDFYALSKVTTVVVKYPSVKNDKYISEK
ncbi:hypothetical protein [Rosenbergiella nectarea]|uniref:hypothetical protein n=1 Tax=Rosenbergiella nectarea TaxID=988801 RepID=UPI001F4DB329|nr:hypothetical protein [Rosenbergiella nectarea]